jgi:hypothetical protein
MANQTVYLLESSNSKGVDRRLVYPGKLRSTHPCLVGDEAFIYSIPRGAPDFMAVARYGVDFQAALVRAGEKKSRQGGGC